MALARTALAKEKEKSNKKKIKDVGNGLLHEVVKGGDALNYPKMGDGVQIHYIASLPDGTVFDSSYSRQQPINFVLGRNMVIPGFEEVVPAMSKGQKSKVTIPPEWAYGAEGYPPVVPPNATIIYEIELMSFSSIGTMNLAELGMEIPPRKTMSEIKN